MSIFVDHQSAEHTHFYNTYASLDVRTCETLESLFHREEL